MTLCGRMFLLFLLGLPGAAPATVGEGPYQEAPMLRARVKSGQLPPVEQRLPLQPAVVEPLRNIGTYGGAWRRLAINPDDTLLGNRLGYEPLIRWDRSGMRPRPGLAKSWQVEEGGRRYVLHLRPGIRWSDGQPFTSEDLMFFFEDMATNQELGGRYLHLAPRDTQMKVTAPDPYRIVFEFDRPNGILLEKLCYRGHQIYAPKHYMKQYHIKYTDRQELDRLAAAEGYAHWVQLFLNKISQSDNPDLPTLNAWTIKVGAPAMMYVAERNPYYWKVDTAGNQLPYIDQIHYQVVDSAEILNLIACTGEADMQGRYIDPEKYTFFMLPGNRMRGGIVRYYVLADPGPAANLGMRFNLSTQNPRLRPYVSDPRFRIAMSLAIDRNEVIELMAGGQGEPINGVGFPLDPYFETGMDKMHIEYDPERANRLLDEVGLKRGFGGMRRYPDGTRFREVVYCVTLGSAGNLTMEQLAIDFWREIGLEFVIKSETIDLGYLRGRSGNFDFLFMGQASLHWTLQPSLYIPVKELSYSMPLYGRYVQTDGAAGVKPPVEFRRLVDWYYQLVHTIGDESRKLELGRNILWQWSNQCYMIGLYRRHDLAIISSRFRNFPDHILHGYRVMFPGYMHPEQFYLESRQYEIHAHAGDHGRIFPSGRFQVYHGNEQELVMTPEPGYIITDVTVDGLSVGAVDSYRIDQVRNDMSVSVRFGPAAQ